MKKIESMDALELTSLEACLHLWIDNPGTRPYGNDSTYTQDAEKALEVVRSHMMALAGRYAAEYK